MAEGLVYPRNCGAWRRRDCVEGVAAHDRGQNGGDDAIEDIFYLASAVGIKNVSVVIAPYDMRKGRKPELERSPLKWYPNLCGEIYTALSEKF